MAEQEQQVKQEQQPTLDDVYRKYNVGDVAEQFAQQHSQTDKAAVVVQQPKDDQIVVPDPVADPDGFKRFVANDHQSRLALRESLQQVSQQFTKYEQQQLRAKEEADIKRAVDLVNTNLKADPDMVEVALGAKARKDPKFLRLYEQRDRNPEAWEAALKAVAVEFEQKFQMKADPQLIENQRAMRTSQQAMATGAREESTSEKLGKLPIHELDRELDKLKGHF